MTGRKRLLKTFRREVVDRVPVALFLYYLSSFTAFEAGSNWREGWLSQTK